RIDGISPPMQPGICLSMTRMLFIKEDKQDGARANQRTADQPHEILSFTALHRYKRVGAVCEIRSLGEIAGFSIAVRKSSI
ncbi:MAG: hypothetical protein PT954_05505, partial [Eubacteriales bacterium]|nr:hypothetical protein [Eubacteriales bacterium]